MIDECSSLAAKWEQISGFLGLRLSLIDTIKQNHPGDNIGCWNDALKHWIKQNYNTGKFHEPSWRSLLKAIARVDRALFKKLASEHQGERSCIQCFTTFCDGNCNTHVQLLQYVEVLKYIMLRKMLRGPTLCQVVCKSPKVSCILLVSHSGIISSVGYVIL